MKKILLTIIAIVCIAEIIPAKAWDIDTYRPANYYYALVMRFKEEDLQREFYGTDHNCYYYIRQQLTLPINIFYRGGGMDMVDIAGILDTEDPAIKNVILMWGKTHDIDVSQPITAITCPSRIGREAVWGTSLEKKKPIRITEEEYEAVFGALEDVKFKAGEVVEKIWRN